MTKSYSQNSTNSQTINRLRISEFLLVFAIGLIGVLGFYKTLKTQIYDSSYGSVPTLHLDTESQEKPTALVHDINSLF